ncbi:MAG: hypothetical protein V4462_08590 [Pseudomonadota bacterium]
MNAFDEYEFWFDAYTPETIPMERLAKYMAALAKMIGHGSSVHFHRMQSGSTVSVLKVKREDAPKVLRRLSLVGTDDALAEAEAGFDELNCLLRDDNAIGRLSRMAADDVASAVVLEFPGRELPRPSKFGPFTEPATIDGELVRIGGKDKSAHAWIVDAEGRSWTGEVSREVARELAQYLYKGAVLRVSGDAKWERNENGSWVLLHFRINAFQLLDNDTLVDAANRLRGLQQTGWVDVDDIDGMITAMRGDGNGLH